MEGQFSLSFLSTASSSSLIRLEVNNQTLVEKQISTLSAELEQTNIVLPSGVSVVCLWGNSNQIKLDNVSLSLTQMHEEVTF